MRNYTLQSLFTPKKRLLLLIILCFIASVSSNAQNLLSSNNNNPGFEGAGGFQTNGYTDISPGTMGSSSDGNYALTGSSGPMNTSSFNNVSPHSGSKMMVIDANNQIFWQQNPNIQLQGGVKYTFSYWVVNINKNGTSNAAFPNPVIQFNAADQCSCIPVLKSGSATVNNATWQQVVYEFTPAGTGAKWVRIELSTPGASPNGNDFAIDDLSLTEPPLPLSISTSQTAISCPGLNDGSISAYGFGGVQPYSYTLTPPVGLPITNSTGIFSNLASGTYGVQVKDNNSPIGSATKSVVINSVLDMTIAGSIPANSLLVPATSMQPLSTTICAGNTITLVANNMVGYTWSATPVDPSLTVPNSASIAVTPTVNTVYKVTATGPTGALSNLVYNGNFENDVAGFSSDYKYLATNPAFEKRTYGVIANPNTWGSVYDSAQDHTNPGTGKFFITDGSTSTPTIDKVWGQNIAVKSGVTYDFNYFLRTITSTDPSHPAKMQLKINGVIINNTAASTTDAAPAITAGGWIAYKHIWTAGVGVTIAVIELYDTEISGSGNDFGLDDITFIPQGAATCTVSKEITVNISPGTSDTTFSYPVAVCQSSTTFVPTKTTPATFTAGGTWSKSSAGGTLSINSSTGEINPSLSTTGTFTVKYEVLQDLSICQAASSSTFNITINSVPSILTTPGGNLCGSGVVSLSATATAGSTINWYTATTGAAFATGNMVNTPSSISSTTNYYVDATLNGCTSSPRTMITATIKPIPTILTSPGGSSCGPGIVNMAATATASSTINWYTATTGASFGTGNSINTPTSISATTTYYVDATLNGCTSTSRTAIVATVNPALTFNCGTQTNSSVTFNWSAVSGATSYDYTYTKSSGGSAITGNIVGTTLNVSGLLPIESVTISVKPIGSSCSIFVGPFTCAASACNTPITDQIVDVKSCANDIVPSQTFVSPLGATATFTWTNDNTAVGLGSSGSGNIPSFPSANVTTTQIAKITVNAYDPATLCTGPDMVFYITVNPLPTVTVNSPAVCAGTSATVIATSGDSGTYNYTWTSSVSTPSDVSSFSTTVAENYSVFITNTVTTCKSASNSGTVTINPLPTVSVATAPVCFGNSATVTAVPGIPGTYNYTWSVPSGATLPGNVTSFSTTVAGIYSVIIADANCSSASASNTVVINPLPTVTVNSPTVCAGTSAIVTATPGIPGTYNYAWTVPTSFTNPGNVASFSTTVAGNYSVILTNPATTCASASVLGTVTVTPLPTLVLSSSASTTNQSLCINTAITPITYTVGGSATSASVTGLPAGVTGSFSSGAFTLSGIPTVAGTFNYLVTTTGGCSPAVSLGGTITVSPLSALVLTSSAATTNQILCMNTALNAITYTVGGSATGANITGLPAGVVGSFATGVVTINGMPTVSGAFNYSVTTTGGCSPTVILGGTITVRPLSTLVLSSSSATTSQTICLNDSITPIRYTVGGSATGANVTGLPAGVTGNFVSGIFTINGTPTFSGTYNYSVTTTGGCSPVIILGGTIIVNPLPVADFTGLTAICSGETTAIVLLSTITGSIFSWNAVQNNATGAASGNGNTINQTLTTTGNNLGQVVYNVTPVVGSCIGLPKMITINVSPVPNVIENTVKKTLCSGETTSIDLSSAIVGTTFSWTVNANGVTGATAGTGNEITQLLSNSGFVPRTVDYTITPSINSCVGVPVVVTITVNPLPEILGTPPGTICSGDVTNITLSPTIAGTTFDWTVAEVGVTGATAGTGNTINQVLEATRNSQGKVTYTITPSLNGCVGTPLDIIVNVNPSPKPALEEGVICVEQATGVAYKTYTLDSGLSMSNCNFQWYLNSLPISRAVSSAFEANQSGDYAVQATNNITGCKATSETAKVIASFPGLAMTTTQTLAFSDNATVTVTVTGGNAVFEYQLDNGPFQSSNVFDELKPGPHTITVGDENGCTSLTQNFFVIGYPKFFSPNGDGHNDNWNVVGLEGQPASIIYIFDRYGKLLKQINPTTDGWDGFYIGEQMPATDYWFTIQFTEQSEIKLFKSHFSLIR
jgi:gliding motility-associated-like protein